MDNRFKLKEFFAFIKVIFNTKYDKNIISEVNRKNCYKRIIFNLLKVISNAIITPFIYPIWYLFRKQISEKIYQDTSWEEILKLMDNNCPDMVKDTLKRNGKFLFWLWTYGDAEDPNGRGGMPVTYATNTFWNRFRYSAIRNPRFNDYYLNFRSDVIITSQTFIDTRNFNIMHKSYGIGDSPDGIYFKWVKDNKDKWYFIYENNNKDNLFYFGYVGLLKQDIGITGARFETGYRKTQETYVI